MHSLARTAILAALIAALVTTKPLPACTPAQRETWPITDRNTIVEGRTILVHTSPDGARRCGEVKRDERRPSQTGPKKVKR